MRPWHLCIFLFCAPVNMQAQTIQGHVTDKVTHKPLFPVTVTNATTKQVAYTDIEGFYSMPANTGDQIVFSCIGYKTISRFKPISVVVATVDASMEHKEYELEEVLLRPGVLTQYQYDSIERVKTYSGLMRRTHPNPFMSPVSALAEKFSKRAKMTYRFQKFFRQAEEERFIDSRYTPELVTGCTGLTGDSVGYFMQAFHLPYDYARVASPLELKMWIRENYRSWKDSTSRNDTVNTGNRH